MGFKFDFDPTILTLGPLQIRYYGVIFAATLYTGFVLWRWQMVRGGYSRDVAEGFLVWGVVGVLAGARIGHCLFYHPGEYLSEPLSILFIWQGGLSSHGAAIGVVAALLLYAWRHDLAVIEVLDRVTMSGAVGAAGIRLGNFLNSEIVGRPTDLPWAVRFMRYEDGGAFARHPSQLYEFALGVFVLLVLWLADRWAGREKRPRALLGGLFLVLYFTGRFLVEFVKEYHIDSLKQFPLLPGVALTMGQYLSILPIIGGVVMLVWVWRRSGSSPAL